jgi:sterol desaturase/sphingolipid hydroxylase (fatty acid hydroxylase superfamily)
MSFIQKYLWLFSTLLVPFLYIVTAVSFYLLLYIWKAKAYKSYKIQQAELSLVQLRKELFYSFTSLIVFTAMGFVVFLLYRKGYSRLYFDVNTYGSLYFVLSILLMMVLHDMYFYWTHRMLHLPGWYEKVHTVHHLSANPSPFTSLSFHPVEAVIQAAILPLIVLIIPSHPFSLFIFLIIMVYKNVRGHCGYDFTTKAQRQKRSKWLQSYSIHHNDHHFYGGENYGLYFTFWDRLMTTFKSEE